MNWNDLIKPGMPDLRKPPSKDVFLRILAEELAKEGITLIDAQFVLSDMPTWVLHLAIDPQGLFAVQAPVSKGDPYSIEVAIDTGKRAINYAIKTRL